MENSILYPLPFAPIFKDKIWGGDKIKTVLYKDFSPLRNCGEMWVLSGHNDDVSVVSDGPLAENDLNELIGIFFDDLMGSKRFSEDNPRFPLLVKIINTNSWLSRLPKEMTKAQRILKKRLEKFRKTVNC